jgi:hypothetical protein
MIRLMVMTMRGRVHDDRRPAMGLMLIGMLDIRLLVVIRPAFGIRTRGNGKRGGSRQQRYRHLAHGAHRLELVKI